MHIIRRQPGPRAAILLTLLLAATPRAFGAEMSMMQPQSADSVMMHDMQRMQQAMHAAPMTGDVDHDFVAMMLPHHQGAIDMAQVELRYGHDPQMRRLAHDIIAAQQRETTEMHAWLAAHAGH